MKGLLPGLSNLCPGTIGSCQYRTLRPAASAGRGRDGSRRRHRARDGGFRRRLPRAEEVAAAGRDDGDDSDECAASGAREYVVS